ncbi:MAG: hypothetical protein FWG17_06305 [Desulfovibrionaceae bacterium]|nr:hypothetical protein [Desulfovibrionaceae bacterium]
MSSEKDAGNQAFLERCKAEQAAPPTPQPMSHEEHARALKEYAAERTLRMARGTLEGNVVRTKG